MSPAASATDAGGSFVTSPTSNSASRISALRAAAGRQATTPPPRQILSAFRGLRRHAEPAANPAPGRRAPAGARRPADGLYPLAGPPQSNTLHYGAGREGGAEAISIEMKWQGAGHAAGRNVPDPPKA